MDPLFHHQEVLLGPKESRVTEGCRVLLDLWDQLDQQDKKENMDFLVVLDALVFLEEKERREILLAHQASLVLLAHLDPQAGFLD